MTASDPREPWPQPAAGQPVHHARRRRPPTGIIVVSIVALVVGAGVLGFLLLRGPAGSQSDGAGPLLIVPSASRESTVPVIKFSTDPGARGTAPTTKPAPTTKVATTKAAPSPKPSKTPKPTKTTTKPKPKTVRAGALCSPPGAVGRNSKGALMVCVLAPDGHGRWRRI